jgi:hypothetical protein
MSTFSSSPFWLFCGETRERLTDKRDTIFDRTKLLNSAKERKPWNRTAAEKERARW